MTGYPDDHARTLKDLAELEERSRPMPTEVSTRVRTAFRRYHLATLTGLEADFDRARAYVNALVTELGPREDLCLLQAQIEGRYHRLDLIEEVLQACPSLAQRAEGRSVQADIDFQEGRYQAAREALEQLVAEREAWDDLARLAHWKSEMGERDEADALLERAEDQLSAKEMRSYAWLELRRGALALSRGDLPRTRFHYERASSAFPGYWRTDTHLVELLIEEQQDDAAVILMRDVVARAPKPELQQALGDILVCVGRAGEAAPFFQAAEQAYLSSVAAGGVHYYHHLSDYYGGWAGRPVEAAEYAQKDLVLRDNYTTQSALAWCHLQAGQIKDGILQIQRALDSGAQVAGIHRTAAKLFEAAGYNAQAKEHQDRAAALSPHPRRFHMHH